MFSLICAWINGWVNNREAGDLRRHRAHCYVTVMWYHVIKRLDYIFYGLYQCCAASTSPLVTENRPFHNHHEYKKARIESTHIIHIACYHVDKLPNYFSCNFAIMSWVHILLHCITSLCKSRPVHLLIANAAVTWFHENHMVAHPDKFQCIMLSRNGRVSIPLSVHNNILYPTYEIKVLCVTLDDSLNFKSHVTDICNRASRQINSSKMFAKYLKIDRRSSVYKIFIQSNFSYCPLAWIFLWKEKWQ